MTIGPIHLVVLEFEDSRFTAEILPALRAAHRQGLIRLLDLLFLQKEASGALHTLQASDLSQQERLRFGAVVGALLGVGAGTVAGGLQAGAVGSKVGAVVGAVAGLKAAVDAFAQDEYGLSQTGLQALTQSLPTGHSAAVVLFEHQWAIPYKGGRPQGTRPGAGRGLAHPRNPGRPGRTPGGGAYRRRAGRGHAEVEPSGAPDRLRWRELPCGLRYQPLPPGPCESGSQPASGCAGRAQRRHVVWLERLVLSTESLTY
jgi:uncharacterized membrane protein